MKFKVQRISQDDFRKISDFTCTEESMTDFLKSEAFECDSTGEGNTYLLKDDTNKILGYYTIKCNAIQSHDEESIYNEYKVYPAIEIARLAIDETCAGKGLGSILLAYIIQKVLELKEQVGIKYIFLFALPSAKEFYIRRNRIGVNFLNFPDSVDFLTDSQEQGCEPLYLPISEYDDKK